MNQWQSDIFILDLIAAFRVSTIRKYPASAFHPPNEGIHGIHSGPQQMPRADMNAMEAKHKKKTLRHQQHCQHRAQFQHESEGLHPHAKGSDSRCILAECYPPWPSADPGLRGRAHSEAQLPPHPSLVLKLFCCFRFSPPTFPIFLHTYSGPPRGLPKASQSPSRGFAGVPWRPPAVRIV